MNVYREDNCWCSEKENWKLKDKEWWWYELYVKIKEESEDELESEWRVWLGRLFEKNDVKCSK